MIDDFWDHLLSEQDEVEQAPSKSCTGCRRCGKNLSSNSRNEDFSKAVKVTVKVVESHLIRSWVVLVVVLNQKILEEMAKVDAFLWKKVIYVNVFIALGREAKVQLLKQCSKLVF